MPLDRPSFDRAALDRGSLDPWGLPPSSSSRRDTEEMLSRVSRSEAESSDAYRRLEEHLRTVARRLDSAERSQSENNRAMNKTATDINIATREQAQAFDQLGGHVMSLSDRMERLERGTAQDGLKDAVKGLHQGLSRLADQITQTANQSATQVTSLAGNLEQLAGRVGQVRADVEDTTRRLEQRLAAVESDTRERFANFEMETARTLDQRLSAVEKASQFNTNALDHALEKLEAQSSVRAGDQAELQKRHAETDGAISRVEENLERITAQHDDPALDRRLDSIERALGNLVSRLETYDPAAPLEDTLRGLTRRLEGIEKSHTELQGELRANLAGGGAPAMFAEPTYDPSIFDHKAIAPAETAFEAPPFAEPVASPVAAFGGPTAFSEENNFEAGNFEAGSFDPATFNPGFETGALNDADPFAADAFGTGALPPPPDFADAAAADENFLSAARRSARAAAEAETTRSGKLGFSWGPSAETDAVASPRPRYLIPAVIGGIVILALVAGIMLSQKLRQGGTSGMPGRQTSGQTTTQQADRSAANNAPFTPAPESGAMPRETPDLKLPPLQQRAVRNAPINGVPSQATAPAQPQQQAQPPARGGPLPTLDRISQLANGGNAVAQTLLGLKELDGVGMPANPADAIKWLQRAAEQGHPVAQYRLGTVYERGQGVGADAAKAARWYEASANQGNRKAMHNLAVAYAEGSTGKKDMAQAARWFAKAAALGLSDSQFNLAVLYERGDGVPQSLLDAFKWYSIAAAAGDTESRTRIGVLGSQLSDDDRSAAQKSATTFHAAPLNRAANVPPEMADLSGN